MATAMWKSCVDSVLVLYNIQEWAMLCSGCLEDLETYACMLDRFSSREIPLMYTERQSLKHENDNVKAYKAEPRDYQPVYTTVVSMKTSSGYRVVVLTILSQHLPHNPQLCVDPQADHHSCNNELQDRKLWMAQVIRIIEVCLDARGRCESRRVQDRVYL